MNSITPRQSLAADARAILERHRLEWGEYTKRTAYTVDIATRTKTDALAVIGALHGGPLHMGQVCRLTGLHEKRADRALAALVADGRATMRRDRAVREWRAV